MIPEEQLCKHLKVIARIVVHNWDLDIFPDSIAAYDQWYCRECDKSVELGRFVKQQREKIKEGLV